MRTGAASTRMEFEEEKEHMVIYQTPMGPLSISLYTEELVSKIEEDKMEMEIRYSLKAEDQLLTESTVRIEICPKELKSFEN